MAMNLLLIPPCYPFPAAPGTGAQNERCARILDRFVDQVVVVSPRPFIPSFLAFRPRWQSYASIPYHHISCGIEVYRPAYLALPGIMDALWQNEAAYYWLRFLFRQLHRKHQFNAILSFDLRACGGVAWRIGRDLGIPAAGWATGSDIRSDRKSPYGLRVAETLQKLEVVMYQSRELLDVGAQILGVKPMELQSSGRHRVLSRGVIEPESPSADGVRDMVRATLHVAKDEVMILYMGRVVRDKGLFGLIDILATNCSKIGNVKLVLVGAREAFDDAEELKRHLRKYPELLERVHILSACPAEEIWTYFAAADIFAFPSFKEGMPNAVLEAMVSGLPVVAFDIPAIQEILAYDREALFAVKAFNFESFFKTLLQLSTDESLRKLTGIKGKSIARKRFSLMQNMKSTIGYLKAM